VPSGFARQSNVMERRVVGGTIPGSATSDAVKGNDHSTTPADLITFSRGGLPSDPMSRKPSVSTRSPSEYTGKPRSTAIKRYWLIRSEFEGC
jgi:hypothetical protein